MEAILMQRENEDEKMYLARLASMIDVNTTPGTPQYRQRQQINEIFFEKVNLYIWDFIHKQYSSYTRDYDDLYAASLTELFKEFPKYDGSTSITTFCNNPIKHACFEYVGNKDSVSRYTNEVRNQIKRATAELLNRGFTPESITPYDIAELCPKKVTPTIMAKTLKIDEMANHCEYDAGFLECNRIFESPESIFMKKVDIEMLEQILSCLYPSEKFVYCTYLGYDMGNVNSEYRQMLQRFADEAKDSGKADPVQKLSFEQIGADPDFLRLIVSDGKKDLIEHGTLILRKHPVECYYVPKDAVKAIFNKAKKKVRSQPAVATKLKSSITNQYYSDDFGTQETAFETIDILAHIQIK